MNLLKQKIANRRSGYTLLEVMVSSAIMSLVVTAAMSAFWFAGRMTRAGGYQVEFNAMGRIASQKITRYIENGRAVAVSSNGLDIMQVDLRCSRLFYRDADGDSSTIEDNCIVYDPDISSAGKEKILCSHVTPIDEEPIFSIIPSTPNVAKMKFHVGDGTNIQHTSFSGTGQGYQGLEIRVSATPRNLQRWYN
ncbi:MAG: type II secretion system protein [Kiritimatiellae bacterium]|nr:type II secretion system protein [Kiritimatiellia bacterium]